MAMEVIIGIGYRNIIDALQLGGEERSTVVGEGGGRARAQEGKQTALDGENAALGGEQGELGHGLEDDDLDDGGDDDGGDTDEAAEEEGDHLARPHPRHLARGGRQQLAWCRVARHNVTRDVNEISRMCSAGAFSDHCANRVTTCLARCRAGRRPWWSCVWPGPCRGRY